MTSDLTVATFMTPKVIIAGIHNKLSEVMHFFATHKIQHLPVTDNEELVGIVSVTDLMRVLHDELINGKSLNIYELDEKHLLQNFMTPDPITVSTDTKISDALRLLQFKKFQALPVVENGKVVGIITNKDMVEIFSKELNPPHPSFTIENPGFGI